MRESTAYLAAVEGAFPGPFPEMNQQGVAVFGTPQGLVADDEAVVRAPGVDAEPALLAAVEHVVAAVDLEVQPEPALHLVAPLEGHGGGADDEDVVDLLAQEQFLHDEPGLDGLAEPHVVGDEEIGPRQGERLFERDELVVHEPDAGAKGALEKLGVAGGDGIPGEGVEPGGELSGSLHSEKGGLASAVSFEHPGAEFEFPKHGNPPPLAVVVQTDKVHPRLPAGRGVFDEILAFADKNYVAGAGRPHRSTPRTETSMKRVLST